MDANSNVMNIEATKLELMQMLLQTQKPSVLKRIKKIFESEIVAYTALGEPLSKSEYKKELLAAEEEIDRGENTTQEDLEKESENW